MANLRIVTANAIDGATISASSTASELLTADNLKLPYKTLVHRASGTSVTYTVSLPGTQKIGMVGLAFTNLSPSATIEVGSWPSWTDFTVDPPVVHMGTTGPQTAAAGQIGAAGFESTTGVNSFTYGGGKYASVYFGHQDLSSFTITINDPGNPDGYVEVGNIIAGDWWTPSRNASYGSSATVVDLTKNERTEAGDLLSSRGPRSRKLNLVFNDFDAADRDAIWALMRYNGLSRPFFASLFPEDGNRAAEQAFQIYGKLSTLSALTCANYSSYSTSMEIEEV